MALSFVETCKASVGHIVAAFMGPAVSMGLVSCTVTHHRSSHCGNNSCSQLDPEGFKLCQENVMLGRWSDWPFIGYPAMKTCRASGHDLPPGDR